MWFRILHQPPGKIVEILRGEAGGGVLNRGEDTVVIVEVGDGIIILEGLLGQTALVTRRGRPPGRDRYRVTLSYQVFRNIHIEHLGYQIME